jgi:hypothetical protein
MQKLLTAEVAGIKPKSQLWQWKDRKLFNKVWKIKVSYR